MNVLNVRYDVYGGVPEDFARSSITISRQFGMRASYSEPRDHYTVFLVPVGLFQIADCVVIRFFKMLKKLEVPSRLADYRGCSVSLPSQEKNIRLHKFRGQKGRRDSDWSIEMLWTAEAVEDLKRLALAGKSASHIAVALGVGSRNAVIGKASRIGIKLSGGGGRSTSGAAPARAGRPQWATARYAPPTADDQGAHVVAARGLSPVEGRGAWTFGEAEIGEMRRLRFEEIRESACRWPLGDPRSGEFAYCGLTPAKGQSYCAGHCRMAYRPPQARARRRPDEQLGSRPLAGSWRLA